MRWRVIVLAVLAVGLCLGAVECLTQASAMTTAGQQIYASADTQLPKPVDGTEANRLFAEAGHLQLLSTPLATGGLLSALGVLVVLARRRDQASSQAPAR